MEREEAKDCTQVTDHHCAFKGKPTLEDCMFCLPTSAISSYRRAMHILGANVKLPFSEAYMIYLDCESTRAKGGKFHELMKLHHPEVYKRNSPQMIAIIMRPNPILEDDNPLTR